MSRVVFQGNAVSVDVVTAWGQQVRVLRHADEAPLADLLEAGKAVVIEWDAKATLVYRASAAAG